MLILCFLLFNDAYSQTIDFSSYNKISNVDFKAFVDLFSDGDLPVSTNSILADFDIRSLPKPALNQSEIEKYLRKKDGGLIAGPIVTEKMEDDLPDHVVEGEFYPLLKLPTSGDFVLLALAQIDPAFEGYDRILVFSFDLEGRFLYLSNYLYTAGDLNTNNSIDKDLRSHRRYVIYLDKDENMIFPPTKGKFAAIEGHQVHQINTNGRSTKVSFEEDSGEFEFDRKYYKFNRLE